MPLNCPSCNHKFKFLDLHFFRLKDYQIKCRKCGQVFKLDGRIDQFGIVLFAIVAMIFLALSGVFLKSLSNYFFFSALTKGLIITLVIIFISFFLVYGHTVYLVWNIKKKYRKNHRGRTDAKP